MGPCTFILYPFIRFLLLIFFKIFGRLRVRGRDVVPKNGPFILASNHLSNLDPPVLAVASPVQLAFLAKEELFRNRMFRWLIRNLNAIPLKRGKADVQALRTALRTLKTKPLLIFPQGTRSNDFSRALSGAGFLCKKTRIPVVLARIQGTDTILPKGGILPRFRRVSVTFSPMDEIDFTASSEEISQAIMDGIKGITP